ncbi:MAG TPA: cysteine--tRNA ligase [Actinomycetaceae bacterium]|nr:cysteine--tRNA ligase [Actinomycetaceae bacterium]
MALHLYDSATRSIRPFEPREPGRAGIYVCGATVQSAPHVGHLRTFLAFDVLRRWLEASGLDVTYIRNVTDIDDKILAKSAESGVPWWAHAYRYEQEFTAAADALGISRPTYEPRATGHVPEMIALTQLLVERGHAYVGDPGNVYFAVDSFPEYGALTNQRGEIDQGEAAATDKRDNRDFALFKAPKPGEPASASWETPWGRARLGWHLECSAMAHRYLGEEFDIHGGGIDLRFPHHENEQAQSRAAGYGFARYWLHSAWVTQGGEKMSKSLGNSLSAEVVLDETPAPVVRLALVCAHYRSTVEFTPTTTAEATANWERFAGFVERATERVGAIEIAGAELPDEFVAAMDDDLGTPQALAVVHEHVRRGNTALAAGDDATVSNSLAAVRAMLAVLGLDPLDPLWKGGTEDSAKDRALEGLVDLLLQDRVCARAEKEWARADQIRDSLAALGVVVEDRPDGATWRLETTKGG